MATLALPDQPSLLDLVEEPPTPTPAPVPAAPAPPFGQRTLEDVVLGAWEALAVDRTTSCPLCAGPLLPRYGAGARPVGSRCADCATELA
jgi:hypothetical protein